MNDEHERFCVVLIFSWNSAQGDGESVEALRGKQTMPFRYIHIHKPSSVVTLTVHATRVDNTLF